jgi:serum/glucocorticoid-regulated kinase 2
MQDGDEKVFESPDVSRSPSRSRAATMGNAVDNVTSSPSPTSPNPDRIFSAPDSPTIEPNALEEKLESRPTAKSVAPQVGIYRAVIVDKNEEVMFSDIVWKYSRFEKHKVRTLMITNVALYNLNKHELRRRVPIQKIIGITVSKSTGEVVLHIPEENDIHLVVADQHKELVVNLIQRLHLMLVGQELKYAEVDEDHLWKHVFRKSLFQFKLLRPRDSSNIEIKAHADDVGVSVDDFQLLKVLGRGAFGKVILARKKDTKAIYAIKILKKSGITTPYQETQVMTERHVLATMNHPFLIQLRFAFQTKDKLYFCTDFYKGGDLYFHLKKNKKFTEEQARFILAEVTLAIGHLHAKRYIYRDLKSENILLDDKGHICITDFGLTAQTRPEEQDDLKVVCGTPAFVAPEMLTRVGYGKAVDWWALGILLYELTVGESPFYSDSVSKMYDKIKWATVINFPDTMSAECKSLIEGLMNKNPTQRLGFSERDVEEIKEHPFFAGIDWSAMLKKEVPSPINLSISNKADDDTSFFDAEHLNAPIDSPVNKKNAKGKHEPVYDQLKGFTFLETNQKLPVEEEDSPTEN